MLGSDEDVVVDMEAGIEHLGRGTAEGVDLMLVVVEPGWASLQTAARVAAAGRRSRAPAPRRGGQQDLGRGRPRVRARRASGPAAPRRAAVRCRARARAPAAAGMSRDVRFYREMARIAATLGSSWQRRGNLNQEDRSVDPAAQEVLANTPVAQGAPPRGTAMTRMQPLCGFGDLGLCCHVCYMGPCRIDPFGEGAAGGHLRRGRAPHRGAQSGARGGRGRRRPQRSRARGGGGPAARGRSGSFASGYALANEEKLRALAAEWRSTTAGRSARRRSLVTSPRAWLAQFGAQEGPLVPAAARPRGPARALGEARHRAARHRSRGRRAPASDPSRRRVGPDRAAAGRHARGAERRLGRFDDRHRCAGRALRRAPGHPLAREPGSPRGEGGQHPRATATSRCSPR